jgi:peptidoglycan/LPS O-acetylase OafA/YrhL
MSALFLVALSAFSLYQFVRTPRSSVVLRIGLACMSVGLIVGAGLIVRDGHFPLWARLTLVSVLLGFWVVSVLRNEGGQRDKWAAILRGLPFDRTPSQED